jgi:carboxymethylenebutenolidase
MAQAAGLGAAAVATTAIRSVGDAEAAMIAADDPRLATNRTTYDGVTGVVSCYLAMPSDATGPLPAICVFHDDCGLGEHIQDVCRRLALAGFLVIAPDFLSSQGGTPASDAAARRLIAEAHAAETLGDAVAAIRFLETHPATTGNVGVTGSCWGGDLTHRAAVTASGLCAAVAWHGAPPPAEDATKIEAALMLHHAEQDPRTGTIVADYAAVLDAAGVTYTLFVYEGVNEAFEDDTNQARYNPAAAALGWQRTIDFFKAKLHA